MAVDVHMPERLGIYQSVGDTAGPGGAMRALRTIPMYVEIAQAIRHMHRKPGSSITPTPCPCA